MESACGPGADVEKIRVFCQGSVEHFQWLVARGVPFKGSYVPPELATNPPADDGLTYTGSELAHPYVLESSPAPRGHNVQHEGDSGFVLMANLLSALAAGGTIVEGEARVEALVVGGEGRVEGVVARHLGEARHVQARGGVVLATGGFGFNPEMLARYAPLLQDCQPVGTPEEDGSGIRLGMAAGGDVLRMDAGCVLLPYQKPRSLTRGILINAQGQRYVNEDVYQALHGERALYGQQGQVYLVVDQKTFAEPQLPFPVLATEESVEEIERQLKLPGGSLLHTLAVYNEHAARGVDPYFHKAANWLVALDTPPFTVIDLRVDTFPYPFFTLGGLRTGSDGQVLTPEGVGVPGLYAAGRVTSGLPAQGYSSGMSLADGTFFGRMAGASAAARAEGANI